MARSYPPENLSTIVANGFLDPLSRARDRVGASLRHARNVVLPEMDADPTEPRPEPVVVEAPPRTRSNLISRLVPAIVALVLLLAIALVVFRVAYADRVYPAIVVGDVPVGGLTVTDAQARLTERAADLENGTVAFTYQGQTWMPSLAELGVSVELDDSLDAAQQLGRGDNATSRLAFIGDILSADQVVPLQTQIDEDALNAWFDSVDQDIDRLPVNASVDVEGTSATIVPGKEGLVVDRKAATAYLLDALSTLEPVAVTLPTRVAQPEISTESLRAVQSEVEELISEPVKATFEGREWTIEPDLVTPFITVEVTMESGRPASHLSIDTRGLTSELRTLYSNEVSRKPTDAVLGWDDGLIVIEPSVNGAAMKSNAFADAVGESFLNGHAPVEIPVVTIVPQVDSNNLDSLGITQLLGGGHSNYAGGVWERDENIHVATELLNHTLVPPGGTFSFNGAIGEITGDKGYQVAEVVVGDEVGRDVGGGVCQVSTTVFRAAINSGMPIVEWYPHTYRLGNYERDGWGPGFDASILQYGANPEDWADFRFENYTDSWLLVEAWYSDVQVFVNFYGTSDGRTVAVDAWPIGGNAFGFTRVIHDAQGNEIANRSFETHFK